MQAFLAASFPDVIYMDVATSAALRPEMHPASKNHTSSDDCLHFTWSRQNPIETWVRLLYNILLLLKSEGGKA